MPVMRRVLGKLLQIAGALVCLLALAIGLGLTPSGEDSLLWEVCLLLPGVILLVGGTLVARRDPN